tara:strand:- start:540 stop:746 length:207 start_codon:yes stop_codon:yes gene_type:complete
MNNVLTSKSFSFIKYVFVLVGYDAHTPEVGMTSVFQESGGLVMAVFEVSYPSNRAVACRVMPRCTRGE